jgi:hypothetical protein
MNSDDPVPLFVAFAPLPDGLNSQYQDGFSRGFEDSEPVQKLRSKDTERVALDEALASEGKRTIILPGSASPSANSFRRPW